MDLQIIENKICEIRGQQVMLDFELAGMYGIETRVLKQSVKRNIERFPEDFMFPLTKEEWKEVITFCDNLPKGIKFSPTTPFAFTELGAAMLSSVLKSEKAIETNIKIMRAFVAVRRYLAQMQEAQIVPTKSTIEERVKALEQANEELLKDINDLSEDTQKSFDDLFNAFSKLTNKINISKTNIEPRKRIGFIQY